MAQILALTLVVCIENSTNDGNENQHKYDSAPNTFPEGWAYFDRKFCNIFTPDTMRIGCLYLENVIAVSNMVEANYITASIVYPFAFWGKSIQAIKIFGLVLAGIV